VAPSHKWADNNKMDFKVAQKKCFNFMDLYALKINLGLHTRQIFFDQLNNHSEAPYPCDYIKQTWIK
jgi:hypothetical protein